MEAELRVVATPERAARGKRYLKSNLEFIGATAPALQKITKALRRRHPDLVREDVVALAVELWDRPVHERRAAAVDVLALYHPVLLAADITVVERFLRESRTWALVDSLAVHVAGRLVTRRPELGAVLDRWAVDDDFWLRRSALLALLAPLRAGGGDFARFARYADTMIDEKEFFVRKAIGWVLRETARLRPELVYEWIAQRTHRASGVTMREAVRRLPEHQRDELMRAYRDTQPARYDSAAG